MALLTEPYLYKGKIVGLPSGYEAVLHTAESPTRAAIMIPKRYKAVCLSHLCTTDCAVVQIQSSKGKIVVASVYMDIKKDIPPPILYEVVKYADSHNYGLVIGADANAQT